MAGKAPDVAGVDRSAFIQSGRGNISDHYKITEKPLGEGSYGTVKIGYEKHDKRHGDGAKRAIKQINIKDIADREAFAQEVELMKGLDHPNIVRLYETYEDKKYVYLVMELCEGGELYDRIIDTENFVFTEMSVSILMKQMFSAIWLCHSHNIMHRDLKPENFLFLNPEPDSPLKVIDFGLAKKFDPEGKNLPSTQAGTPYYVAPEVMDDAKPGYTAAVDMWSLGVMMYILLCGYPPFNGGSDSEILKAVRKGRFRFDYKDKRTNKLQNEEWTMVSADAKSLITKLLVKNPAKRYTPEEAMNDKWIKENASRSHVRGRENEWKKNLGGVCESFRCFRDASKMKKIALTLIATQLHAEQVKALRTTFETLDANGDGTLTFDEVKAAMYEHKIDIPEDLMKTMNSIDSDRSGKIDYTEFIAATMDKRMYIQEDAVWSAFRIFDTDDDGAITVDELRHILQGNADNQKMVEAYGPDVLKDIIAEVDTNGDGKIDFDEFMAMMQSHTEKKWKNRPQEGEK